MYSRTNTKTTKPLLMLAVAVAAVIVMVSSFCIVLASEDTSAAGMHQVHFEPNGGTVYCKMTPCRTCAMLIINCGIKRVVCEKHYHDEEDSLEMFKQAGVAIEHLEDTVQTYKDM